MITQEKYNQVVLINGIAHIHNVNATRQRLLEHVDFGWSHTSNRKAIISEIRCGNNIGCFYHVFFDFVKAYRYEIVKVSNRVTTTDFQNFYSLN